MVKLFRTNHVVSLSPPFTCCAFAATSEVAQVNAQPLKTEVFKFAAPFPDRPRTANCVGAIEENRQLKRPLLTQTYY
jgi:hypothetical protein